MELSIESGVYTSGTAQTIGARTQQQDVALTLAHGDEKSHALFAVLADGMGGMAHGERFSRFTADVMVKGIQGAATPLQNAGELLAQLALHANKQVYALQDEGDEGGTTLVAAFIQHSLLTFVSVGDSRIDLYRGGALLQLNRQHTLGALLDERACMGLISEDDARSMNCRHALSSYIGAETIKHIDIIERPIQLLTGDRVVLMSDGVFNTLSDAEIAGAIQQAASAEECAESVIDLVQRKQLTHQDNASIVIVEITQKDRSDTQNG